MDSLGSFGLLMVKCEGRIHARITYRPWADLPQSALGSGRSQTPSKVWHTKCVCNKRYPLEALVIMHKDANVAYCHQKTPAAMEMILAILGYVMQEAKTFALQ